MKLFGPILTQGQRVVLAAHINPDGDAVGSVLSLAQALEQQGIQAIAVLRDPVPAAFSFLPKTENILSDLTLDADWCILLDMNDLSRSGFSSEVLEYAKRKRLIVIDHHPKGDLAKLATYYFHNEKLSSVCELLTIMLQEEEVKITPDLATTLLTGIYTDTGGFQHENATTQTLERAAELMKRGARLHTIARFISRTKSIASLKLLGIALDRLKITEEGIAISALAYADLEACHAQPEDIAGIVNEMNSIPEAKLAVLLCETSPGFIRGTVRSGEGSRVSAQKFAKLFGGGGHPRASGFSFSGRISKEGEAWKIFS